MSVIFDTFRTLSMRHLHPNDQIIVSSAISRLEALINTIDCFPSDDSVWHLMQVANAWACRKHSLGNLRLARGSPYEKLLSSRVSQTKSGLVDCAVVMVPDAYELGKIPTDEVIEYNRATVKYWLADANFTCPKGDFGALYERPAFEHLLKLAFFQTAASTGVVHRDLFRTITIPTLAGAATALEKALMEHETGVRVKQNFMRGTFLPKWTSHVGSLCQMFKSEHSDRLIGHLRELGKVLLSPFPETSDSMSTIVIPRISAISSRYGRAIAAPPPLPPPSAPSFVKPNSKPKPKALPPPAMSAPAATQPCRAIPLVPVPPVRMQNPSTGPESSSESESGDDQPTDVGDPKAWDQALEGQVVSSTSKYDALLETDSSATQSPSDYAIGGQGKVNVDDASSGSDDSEGSADEASGQKGVVRKPNKKAAGSDSSDSSDSGDEEGE